MFGCDPLESGWSNHYGIAWTHHWRCSLPSEWRRSQTQCLWPHSWRCRLCTKFSCGHLTGSRDWNPAARNRFLTVWTVMCLPKCRIICILSRGADIKRFILTIRSKWQSSHGADIFVLLKRFLCSGRPCCLLRRRTLQTHPCVAPTILAASHLQLSCVDNKIFATKCTVANLSASSKSARSIESLKACTSQEISHHHRHRRWRRRHPHRHHHQQQ